MLRYNKLLSFLYNWKTVETRRTHSLPSRSLFAHGSIVVIVHWNGVQMNSTQEPFLLAWFCMEDATIFFGKFSNSISLSLFHFCSSLPDYWHSTLSIASYSILVINCFSIGTDKWWPTYIVIAFKWRPEWKMNLWTTPWNFSRFPPLHTHSLK